MNLSNVKFFVLFQIFVGIFFLQSLTVKAASSHGKEELTLDSPDDTIKVSDEKKSSNSPTLNFNDKTNNIELSAKDIQLHINNLINKKDNLSINFIIKLIHYYFDILPFVENLSNIIFQQRVALGFILLFKISYY